MGVCVGVHKGKKSANCHSIIFSSPLHTLHVHTIYTSPSNAAHDARSTFPTCSVYFPYRRTKCSFCAKKALSTLTTALSKQKTTYKSETWTLQPQSVHENMQYMQTHTHTCMHMKTHITTWWDIFRDAFFLLTTYEKVCKLNDNSCLMQVIVNNTVSRNYF